MQPLKIVIPGEFWDTQMYSGRLYMFRSDGAVQTVDWDRLISEWKLKPELAMWK
jgi:hypothetical protein